jgi:hypothetical protein
MNEEQMRVEFEGFLATQMPTFPPELLFERRENGEYVSLVAHYSWKAWQAAIASQAKSVPPIERDEEMQRDYTPLPANWEIQTKGKGSTFRLAKADGSYIYTLWPILEKMLHEPLEQMAREIHAAWLVSPQAPTDDERVRELERQINLLKEQNRDLTEGLDQWRHLALNPKAIGTLNLVAKSISEANK